LFVQLPKNEGVLRFRVSSKERTWLEDNAGNMTISAFIRWLIFGDDAMPRRANET